MQKTVRRWGYSADDAQIFELPVGADLPPGYYDSPAKVKARRPLFPGPQSDEDETVPDKPSERDRLIAEALKLDIQIDGRWGNARLREEIEAAKRATEPAPEDLIA